MNRYYKYTIVIVLLPFLGIDASIAGSCPFSIAGDLNDDCQVTFVDVAILANNWLADCDAYPRNSGCFHNWQPEPPMRIARDQFTGGVIDGKIYVFGGNGNPDQVNLKSAEVYDPATDWSDIAENTHNGGQGVEELTGAVVDGNLYVFGAWGGTGPGGHYGDFNFNERYDPDSDTWTSLAPKPTVVTAAPATVYNGEIYLFGGSYNNEDLNEPNNYDVVEAYDPNTNTWRLVTNMPELLKNFGLATIDDKAYLIGGYLPDEERMTGEVITFDFNSQQWDTNCCEPLPDDRVRGFSYSHSVPVVNDEIFLIGGIEGNQVSSWASNKVDIYDTNTDTWQVGPSLPLPLELHLPVIINGKIYVLGGHNGYDYLNRSKAEVISLSIGDRYAPEGMVYIPDGNFVMGDHFDPEGYTDELPLHDVLLDAFFMSKFEITNSQYCDYLNDANSLGLIEVRSGVVYASPGGTDPYCDTSTSNSWSQIDYSGGVFSVATKDGRDMSDDPMVMVSWYGSVAYCNWRSSEEGYESCYNLSTWECDFSKHGYRLPTEAEWEYAARGGLSGKRFPWADPNITHSLANYYANPGSYSYDVSPTSGSHPLWNGVTPAPDTSPVGFFDGTIKYKVDYNWPGSDTSYQTTSGANGYGLYDMAGNAWEWCNDWYDSDYYNTSPYDNPTGPASGFLGRVLRGGGWYFIASYCRVANRDYDDPGLRYYIVGFRVALDLN